MAQRLDMAAAGRDVARVIGQAAGQEKLNF